MKSFKELPSQKGTKIYLFMTWSYQDQPDMFPSIKTTYEDGAKDIGATLVPIGQAWASIVEEEHPNVVLYSEDGIHPSLQGTFFAAAMFYVSLYGKNPSDNSYNPGLEEAAAQYLKEKAN